MSAVLKAGEPAARYLVDMQPALVRRFDLLATAPGGVARLRELIFALAVQGKLVRQNPSDEPATDLLIRIRVEKARLTSLARLRAAKSPTADDDLEPPYALPAGWAWSTVASIGLINPRNEAADGEVASFVQMSSIPAAYSEAHATEPRAWRDIKSGFTQFAEGDVGVAKITPCFENGKSTVFRNLSSSIGAGTTELHIVRPLCGIDPRYVLAFLKSPGFLREGEAVMTGTAGQKRLPRLYFESKPFPLPPLAEQARIVARVDELMRLCDALEAKGRLEAAQHAQLLNTLLGTLADSASPESHVSPPPANTRSAPRGGQVALGSGPAGDLLAANWQRVAAHFDLLLDRPEAVDALEQTILQLAVRGLLVPQDPNDEPASVLLARVRAKKERLIGEGAIKRNKPVAAVAADEIPFALPDSWALARIDELSDVQGGLQKTPLRRPVRNHYPYLRVANVQRDAVQLDHMERFELSDEELARWRLLKGDLLIVEGNGSADEIGRCALWHGQLEPCVYQNHLIRVRCVEDKCVEFVKLFLNAPAGKDEMKRLAITTSGLFNLSVGKIRHFALPVPPLAEQARIVARVEELRRLCAALRQRLATGHATQTHLADALVEQASA